MCGGQIEAPLPHLDKSKQQSKQVEFLDQEPAQEIGCVAGGGVGGWGQPVSLGDQAPGLGAPGLVDLRSGDVADAPDGARGRFM